MQKTFVQKAALKILVKLTPGGSMDSRYILQFLFSEKIANNSTTTEAREKNKHPLGNLRILEMFLIYVWQNFKTIKFYLIK